MLAGHPDSARFVSEYADLRRVGAPIERALVLVGHEERLRQHEHAPIRLAWRGRPVGRSRPSVVGLVASVHTDPAIRARTATRMRRLRRRSDTRLENSYFARVRTSSRPPSPS
jgi:hypothetical protein